MRTIWKVPLKIGTTEVELPGDSEALHVAVQNGRPCVWVAVETEKPTSEVRFVILGTGHEIPATKRFIHLGSFMLDKGAFVGHVFVEREP